MTIKASIKKKWLKALRSDDYQQGSGCLKDGEYYCCLGILADIVDPNKRTWQPGDAIFGASRKDYISGIVDRESQVKLLGGYIPPGMMDRLIDMNDDDHSFHDIADYIEKSKRV